MLEGHGIPADPADLLLREVPAPPPGIQRGASVIHPGAASGARRWPADRWAAVVAAERDAGRPVVLTGSAAERALAERVAVEAGGGAVVVAGRTGLSELAGIVAGAGRVLCGDTGIAHLASALRRPSVVLFGPTSPVTWGPPADGPHEVLWAGRTGDPHAGEPDPGLLEIGAVDVLLAIDRLEARLAAAPAAHHSSCSTFQRVSASSSSGP
jgi:ADP-heptose:LPS heptosyltransferase